MRIALIGGHGGRSGVPRHISQLCTHLAPRADLVVVSDINQGGYDFTRTLDVEHRIVPGLASSLNPFRIKAAGAKLTQVLDETGPFDVIWAHARLALPLCRAYVRRRALPARFIATYHGCPFAGRPWIERFVAREFEKFELRHTPHHDLVFLSQNDRSCFDRLKTSQHRLHTIPNCSDLGGMQLSNGPQHPTLVMTTRACRQKDLQSTAKIFETLPQTYRLVLLGMGADTIARRQFRRILAPEAFERVSFHGPVEDVRPFLVGADGYLLTSRYEGHSIGSLEAFEAGLPVIMPAIGGAAEIRASHPQHAIIRKDKVAAAAQKIDALVRAFRSDRSAHIWRNRMAWNATFSASVWGAAIDALLEHP